MKKTIYLANPYGFSVQQKSLLLPELAVCAGGAGPWRCGNRSSGITRSTSQKSGWAYRIGQADLPGRGRVGWDICGGQRQFHRTRG